MTTPKDEPLKIEVFFGFSAIQNRCIEVGRIGKPFAKGCSTTLFIELSAYDSLSKTNQEQKTEIGILRKQRDDIIDSTSIVSYSADAKKQRLESEITDAKLGIK